MEQFIHIYEAVDCLRADENISLLPKKLQQELNYFCDQIDEDESYIFADLILDGRNKTSWGIRMVNDTAFDYLLPLNTPEKQLKRSVYQVLKQGNLIHVGDLTNTCIVE